MSRTYAGRPVPGPTEASALLQTAEDAAQQALDAWNLRAMATAEPPDWKIATDLRIVLQHLGAALLAAAGAREW